jgi:hypothetical protein
MTLLGDCGEESEDAIKIALSCLTTIVKKTNTTLLELASSNSLGFEMSVKLSDRVNEYFIKFLRMLLVNDSVASYFVFDLSGFEFLLDTIGVGSENESVQKRLGDTGLEFEFIEHVDNDMIKGKRLKAQDLKMISQESVFESPSIFASLQGSDLAIYLESNLKNMDN